MLQFICDVIYQNIFRFNMWHHCEESNQTERTKQSSNISNSVVSCVTWNSFVIRMLSLKSSSRPYFNMIRTTLPSLSPFDDGNWIFFLVFPESPNDLLEVNQTERIENHEHDSLIQNKWRIEIVFCPVGPIHVP